MENRPATREAEDAQATRESGAVSARECKARSEQGKDNIFDFAPPLMAA